MGGGIVFLFNTPDKSLIQDIDNTYKDQQKCHEHYENIGKGNEEALSRGRQLKCL